MADIELIAVPFDGYGRPGNQANAAGALHDAGLVDAFDHHHVTDHTIDGTAFSSSVETSASPTPSWVIAVAQSKSGLARKVSAAVFTAFCSRGV